jgi:hypothetical protein
MGEDRHYLLQMMGHEYQGGSVGSSAEILKGLKKLLSRYQVQSGARLVKDEQARVMDEGSSDKETLLFSL